MTKREITYHVLRDNAGMWVSGKVLVEAGAGWRFGARIHELRQAGHRIERKADPDSAIDMYRLVIAEQIDFGLEAA